MFMKPEIFSVLVNTYGIGQHVVEALCDWYKESKARYESSESAEPEALWAFLDQIKDDADDLLIFIVDNLLSHEGAARYMQILQKKMPHTVNLSRFGKDHDVP